MGKSSKKYQQQQNHSAPQSQPPKPAPQKERPQDSPKKPETWVRKKITATLQSDAHLGSGVGGQGLHALLARDREGHPVIWSTHLEGLLREAARVLYPADEARLFGTAGGSRQALVFTSLYLAQDEPQSRVWRSTARVSFGNRAPNADTLRAIEFVPKGTVFEGEVELKKSDKEKLERLLQEIESIGHGRASGAGLVSLKSSEFLPDGPDSFQIQQPRLRLLLRNRDPLCIAKTATPGNIIPTQPYIPGRTLLGALAAWLIAEGTDEAKQAAELLVNGTLSVSDALPLKGKDLPERLGPVEILPAPLSLQSQKPRGQVGNVPWWAREKSPTIYLDKGKQDKDRQQEKLKRPEPDLFVQRIGNGSWETHRPDIRIRLRNGRPSPSDKDPSLFAIEQIAEDTRFLTELRGSIEDMRKLCDALLPVLTKKRWLRIGRGGVPVQVEKAAPLKDETLPATNRNAYLILTADLLFRDDSLRWQTRLTASNTKDLPGWPEAFSQELTKTDFDPILQEETEIRGWNGTSRLWRLPAAGIRRGSVFKVSAALAQKLRELASQGKWLGERTHEGFGRFRIDDEDKLPGVTASPNGDDGSQAVHRKREDDPSEQVASVTKSWFNDYAKVKETESSPKPSLSQWFDLVTELEQGKKDALESRLKAEKAGWAGWKHAEAQKILKQLKRMMDLKQKAEAEYARMFVRWLRADLKRKDSGTQEAEQEVAGCVPN